MGDLENIRIGVLGGGVSPEREISLESARSVHCSLLRKNTDAVLIDVESDKMDYIVNCIKSNDIDAAFIALHGFFGEDGKIQSMLDSIGVAYSGSPPRACSLSMDKIASKEIFAAGGIPTPAFTSLDCHDDLRPENIGYPVVVKPCSCGSSLGVSIVDSEVSLAAALRQAFRLGRRIMLEEFIDGREFTVGILGQRPLAVVEILPHHGFYDFQNKYADGRTDFIAPAELDEKTARDMQKIALAAHNALGCYGFSRVDFRLSAGGGIFVLEVNAIPGLTSHSLLPLSAASCGIDFDSLIQAMARTVLSRTQAK